MDAKKRINWIDMAKGYGMICVIIGHLNVPYLGLWVYTFHMPLFFFLSGYVFNTKDSFKTFIQGKITKILVPYFCLGFIALLFKAFWNRWSVLELIKNIFYVFVIAQRCDWALWFIPCLFVLNILFYILVKTVKKLEWMVVVIAILLFIGACYYRLGGILLPWNVDVCFMALPFFFAGYVVKKNDSVLKFICTSKYNIGIFLISGILNGGCGILNNYIDGIGLDMYCCSYGIEVLAYISAFAGIVCVVIFSNWITLQPIRYIGENSFIYLAWHSTICIPLFFALYEKMGIFQQCTGEGRILWQNFSRMIVTTIAICVILSIINMLIKKTKLKFIVGK